VLQLNVFVPTNLLVIKKVSPQYVGVTLPYFQFIIFKTFWTFLCVW